MVGLLHVTSHGEFRICVVCHAHILILTSCQVECGSFSLRGWNLRSTATRISRKPAILTEQSTQCVRRRSTFQQGGNRSWRAIGNMRSTNPKLQQMRAALPSQVLCKWQTWRWKQLASVKTRQFPPALQPLANTAESTTLWLKPRFFWTMKVVCAHYFYSSSESFSQLSQNCVSA